MEETGASSILLLKPHGSLNWNLSETGNINFEKVKLLNVDYYWRRLGVPTTKLRRLPIDTAELLIPNVAWGERMRPPPYIVPPTWNKVEYQSQLQAVWKLAIAALSVANNIFVSGYSLPSSDQFFRSVFALGMMSPSMIDNFIVFDPGDVESTWQSLCGSAIRDRKKFRHERTTFEGAIAWIMNNMDLSDPGVTALLRR